MVRIARLSSTRASSVKGVFFLAASRPCLRARSARRYGTTALAPLRRLHGARAAAPGWREPPWGADGPPGAAAAPQAHGHAGGRGPTRDTRAQRADQNLCGDGEAMTAPFMDVQRAASRQSHAQAGRARRRGGAQDITGVMQTRRARSGVCTKRALRATARTLHNSPLC
jgi:hypothetical protein